MGQNLTVFLLVKNHKPSGNTSPQSVCHQKGYFTVLSPLPPLSAAVWCYSGEHGCRISLQLLEPGSPLPSASHRLLHLLQELGTSHSLEHFPVPHERVLQPVPSLYISIHAQSRSLLSCRERPSKQRRVAHPRQHPAPDRASKGRQKQQKGEGGYEAVGQPAT